jgi:hypothetical protein
MKVVGTMLAAIYSLLLFPVLFFGWAAYSDYNYLGCPGEAISQCGDAENTMWVTAAYLGVGAVIAVALWLASKFMRSRKVTTNA